MADSKQFDVSDAQAPISDLAQVSDLAQSLEQRMVREMAALRKSIAELVEAVGELTSATQALDATECHRLYWDEVDHGVCPECGGELGDCDGEKPGPVA